MKRTLLYRLMLIMLVLSCVTVLGASLYSWSLVAFLTNEIKNNIEGRVIAACGADINDEMIVSVKRRENMLRILWIAAVVAVFAGGALCLAAFAREARFAREAESFKSNFLAGLEYETKSPFSAMSANAQLAAELLDAGARDDEIMKEIQETLEIVKEIKGVLETVNHEAERLTRMSSAPVTFEAEQSEQ